MSAGLRTDISQMLIQWHRLQGHARKQSSPRDFSQIQKTENLTDFNTDTDRATISILFSN